MTWFPDEIGDEFYDEFAPLVTVYGEMPDLEAYMRALGRVMQPIFDISKDGGNGDDEIGWSQALDRLRAKDSWLRWLGQWVGYDVPQAPTSYATERVRMQTRSAHRRGSIAILREVVQEHLSGTKDVIIQERVGDAGHISVFVFNAQITTTAALVEAAARSQKAGGLIMTFTILTGANYTLFQASNASYTVALGKHANYNSVLTNPGL
jgi:hypothetical protein